PDQSAASGVLPAFFFSSRRRHTRFSRDWSSDVCSSDLMVGLESVPEEARKLMRSIKATPLQTFRKVSLPHALPVIFAGVKAALRSEERRVGKECRAGGSTDH